MAFHQVKSIRPERFLLHFWLRLRSSAPRPKGWKQWGLVSPQSDVRGKGQIGRKTDLGHRFANLIRQTPQPLAPIAIDPHPLRFKFIGKTSRLSQFDLEGLKVDRPQRLGELWQKLFADVVTQKLERQVIFLGFFNPRKIALKPIAVIVKLLRNIDADKKSHGSMIIVLGLRFQGQAPIPIFSKQDSKSNTLASQFVLLE
jgi:hypothetical protein